MQAVRGAIRTNSTGEVEKSKWRRYARFIGQSAYYLLFRLQLIYALILIGFAVAFIVFVAEDVKAYRNRLGVSDQLKSSVNLFNDIVVRCAKFGNAFYPFLVNATTIGPVVPLSTSDSSPEEEIYVLNEQLVDSTAKIINSVKSFVTPMYGEFTFVWLIAAAQWSANAKLQTDEGTLNANRILDGIGGNPMCSPIISSFVYRMQPQMKDTLFCDNSSYNTIFAAVPVDIVNIKRMYNIQVRDEFIGIQNTIQTLAASLDTQFSIRLKRHAAPYVLIIVTCVCAAVLIVVFGKQEHEVIKERNVVEADFAFRKDGVRMKRSTQRIIDYFCWRLSIMRDPMEPVSTFEISTSESLAFGGEGGTRLGSAGAEQNLASQSEGRRSQVELYLRRAAAPIHLLRPFVPQYLLKPNTELYGTEGNCSAVVSNPELVVLDEGLKLKVSTFLFVDMTVFNSGHMFEESMRQIGVKKQFAERGSHGKHKAMLRQTDAEASREEEMRLVEEILVGDEEDAPLESMLGTSCQSDRRRRELMQAGEAYDDAGVSEELLRVVRGGLTESTLMINELLTTVSTVARQHGGTIVQVQSEGILVVFHPPVAGGAAAGAPGAAPASAAAGGAAGPQRPSTWEEDFADRAAELRAVDAAFAVKTMCENRTSRHNVGAMWEPLDCKMCVFSDTALQGITNFHVSKTYTVLSKTLLSLPFIVGAQKQLDVPIVLTSSVNEVIRSKVVSRPVHYLTGVGSLYYVLRVLDDGDKEELSGARRVDAEDLQPSYQVSSSHAQQIEREWWERTWGTYEAILSTPQPTASQLKECMSSLREYRLLYVQNSAHYPIFTRVLQDVRSMLQKANVRLDIDDDSD